MHVQGTTVKVQQYSYMLDKKSTTLLPTYGKITTKYKLKNQITTKNDQPKSLHSMLDSHTSSTSLFC